VGDHAEAIVKRYAEPLVLAHDTEHLSKFEELLEAAVDLDRIPDEYLISASYDNDLKDIQGQKMAVEQEIQQAAEAAAEDLGLILDKSVKLEWHKVSNQKSRCLRITAKEEKIVRKKLQAKYIELETRKDGVKFTSRRLRNAAQQLQQLSSEYDAKQSVLVKQVVAVAATFSEVWEKVSAILGDLDVLCGFAEVAASAPTPYARPEILPQDGMCSL
jgi:DNA mismatch repair protein MSH2